MRRRIPSIIVVVVLIAIGVVAANFREELTNLPRIRVGPLVSEGSAKEFLRFFVLGDTGTGGEAQYGVAATMEERCRAQGGIDGILLLGDNAYQGGFHSVEDPQWQEKVMRPYGTDCLSDAPIYPVLGNHDYKGNPASQIEFTLLYERWRMPNRFYAVRFGDLLNLVAFDSQVSEFCFKPSFCTVDFLFDQIKQGAAATWTIVMAHHPLKSASSHGHGHSGGLRNILLGPWLCHKIDAWVAGHAHHLEHRKVEGCRMQHFVSGGGGAELYPVEVDSPEVRYADAQHGFLEIELDRERFVSRFIGMDGRELYRSERLKEPR